MDKTLKNKIIFTALGTLTAVCFMILVAFLAFGLFSPKTFSDTLSLIGFDNMSLNYSCAVYDRTGDINDLANVIDRAVIARDFQKTSLYTEKMINDEHFSDFADYSDAYLISHRVPSDCSYKRFVFGNYTLSSAMCGKALPALTVATDYLSYANGKLESVLSFFLMAGRCEDVSVGNFSGLLEKASSIRSEIQTQGNQSALNSLDAEMKGIVELYSIENTEWNNL